MLYCKRYFRPCAGGNTDQYQAPIGGRRKWSYHERHAVNHQSSLVGAYCRKVNLKMKKAIFVILILCFLCSFSFAEAAEEPGFLRIEDGMLQPVLNWTDLRDEDYTNEGSDILRFCVWVETDYDTDLDGKADLVRALVQVPRAAAEGRYKAAVIYNPTPYGAGTGYQSCPI